MSNIKWIKITTGMFDDEKIKLIQSMPEGDSILVVWIRLLTLAGKTNDGGFIYLSESMPYTDEMLACIFAKPLNVVRMAIQIFTDMQMLEVETKGLYVVNWDKHQNIDALDKIREQTRQRVADHRKKKLLASNVTSNVTVTVGNALEEDLEEELDKEKEVKERVPINEVFDLYLSLCPDLIQLRDRTENRKKAIKTLWKQHPDLGYFNELFGTANRSNFLTGDNERGFKADFDWVIKATNATKIIEGRYANRPAKGRTGSPSLIKSNPGDEDKYKLLHFGNFDDDDDDSEGTEK